MRWGRATMTLVAVLGALALAAAPAGAVDPFNFGNPEFCEPDEPVRDFGFSRLPAVRGVPVDGQLPFARPNVNIYGGPTFGSVLTGRGSFGYGFSEENYEGTVRLDWTVTAQMWLLGGGGARLRQVDADTLYIGELSALHQPHIDLETLGRRGFYRFDIQFADADGNQLGAYSAYVKVARPFWKARLGLDKRVYRPGDLLLSRPENHGTKPMTYGEDVIVQRWADGGWRPARYLWPKFILLWLGFGSPGSPGRCSPLGLPDDVAPGWYRLVKPVTELFPHGRDRLHRLVAPFRVTAST